MRKRIKLRKIWIILLVILVLLLIYPTYLTISIASKDYKLSSIYNIVVKGIKDEVLDNDYSKTLEEAVNSKEFDKSNVEEYFDIVYVEKDYFINRINKLIKIGYSVDDINKINNKLTDEIVDTLYNHELIKDISKYLEFDYFKSENLYRYLAYYNGNYQQSIVYVNIGLDKDLYQDVNVITTYSVDVLANKYNKLDENFEPDNLVLVNSSYVKGNNKEYLSAEAKNAFELMAEEAKKEGKYLLVNSAYRSYSTQQDIYDTYLRLYGKTYVDNYVALPGYSEHQTGLALDVAARGYNVFKTSPEYKWMLENAYKYGFILRYPENKQNITGYKNETWHFRYVGIDAAKYIQENKITYEEYYVMFLDK